MEEGVIVIYTAASHQGAIKMIWFWVAVMSLSTSHTTFYYRSSFNLSPNYEMSLMLWDFLSCTYKLLICDFKVMWLTDIIKSTGHIQSWGSADFSTTAIPSLHTVFISGSIREPCIETDIRTENGALVHPHNAPGYWPSAPGFLWVLSLLRFLCRTLGGVKV